MHGEEWDGDIPLELQRPSPSSSPSPSPSHSEKAGDVDVDVEEGEVVFAGSVLPWRTGRYEVRYHHDGKYNVMGLAGPIEIYGAHAARWRAGARLT